MGALHLQVARRLAIVGQLMPIVVHDAQVCSGGWVGGVGGEDGGERGGGDSGSGSGSRHALVIKAVDGSTNQQLEVCSSPLIPKTKHHRPLQKAAPRHMQSPKALQHSTMSCVCLSQACPP